MYVLSVDYYFNKLALEIHWVLSIPSHQKYIVNAWELLLLPVNAKQKSYQYSLDFQEQKRVAFKPEAPRSL